MGSIRVDQQTWRPAKVADEAVTANGGASMEWILLRFLLYASLAVAAITIRAPEPEMSNRALLVGTVALAGLACSCRRPA